MAAMRRFGFPLFALVMLLLPVLPVPDFWITQTIYIGLYALVALGLVLLTGVSGLTSFGQAAFVGVGAYTAAYMTVKLGASPWLALPVGVALAVVAALVLGAITLRMSGHYLPLATIAWGLALYYSMGNMEFLGKYDGLLGVPTLHVFGIDLCTGRGLHVLVWAFALLAAWACANLLDSRPGRAIRAVRDGSTMAEAMGISTFRYKLVVFVLAAVLAAVSGWLFAFFQRTVNPSPFSITKGIEYLFIAVLGGVSHVWGAFLGAGVVRIVEDQLQVLLPRLIGTSGNFETIVFGIVLIVVLKYAPDGLWTFVRGWLPRSERKRDWDGVAPLPAGPKPARGEPLLQVEKVRKEFGGLVAVNDVSFEIRAGDIVGLIGPNGAGKSTTFNLITGVLSLTAGQPEPTASPTQYMDDGRLLQTLGLRVVEGRTFAPDEYRDDSEMNGPDAVAPAMLAQKTATFDQFSKGRLIINVITGEKPQFRRQKKGGLFSWLFGGSSGDSGGGQHRHQNGGDNATDASGQGNGADANASGAGQHKGGHRRRQQGGDGGQ